MTNITNELVIFEITPYNMCYYYPYKNIFNAEMLMRSRWFPGWEMILRNSNHEILLHFRPDDNPNEIFVSSQEMHQFYQKYRKGTS
jgi:hypothetical protein